MASPAVIEGGSTPTLLRDPALYGVALVALVVCAPCWRYVHWLGDEGVFLHAAARILGGEVLYRDFFEFLPPGSFLAVAAWMKLFGVGFGSVRVLAICVIVAIAALLYAAARLSSGHRPIAAMLAIAWVVFSQGVWTVISHHWFTTAASMATAVALLLAVGSAPRRGAALVAGLVAGGAAMVTSSRGALLCLAVLAILATLPGAGARLVSAIMGIALIPAAMILYLAASGTLVAPLACPLFALVATDLLGRMRRPARIALGALLIGLCLAAVGSAIYDRRVVVVGPLRAVETPRGRIVRFANAWTNDFAALVTQIDRIPPRDAFFFYPYGPMLPYLTGRRHAAALDVMTPGYTDPAEFRATCVQVVTEAQWLVVETGWTHPVVIRGVWPALRDPDPPEKHSFEVALATAFNKVIHASDTFQLRQRAGDASLALCDKVGATPNPR